MSELTAFVVAAVLTVARPSTVRIAVRWDVAPVETVSSSAAVAIAVAAFVVAAVAVTVAVVLIRRNRRRQGTPPPTTTHSPQD